MVFGLHNTEEKKGPIFDRALPLLYIILNTNQMQTKQKQKQKESKQKQTDKNKNRKGLGTRLVKYWYVYFHALCYCTVADDKQPDFHLVSFLDSHTTIDDK